MSGSELRLVLVGFGAIGQEVARRLAGRPGVALAGVAVRDPSAPREGLPAGAGLIGDPSELAALAPDMVVEAAGRASVGPWGRAALELGARFAVSSTSAFTEEGLLDALTALAEARGGQLIVPPGALGGIDALAAAALLPLDAVRHEIIKPPRAWIGSPAERLCDLDTLSAPVTFFEGSAREAGAAFPQNANVTVITALAGLGLDRTRVAMTADPGAVLNAHRIVARGAFGKLDMRIENQPLEGNPKSSAMTALSLVRLIETQSATLRI
ncbi:aspartate dehydrogenase [Acidimangrovimonas pyrenivorans]|uniref:L-aspartate dehydrogenase n=1 Tax=Acidimangrovimonas pyrenivorans TaxID=2030798 RepID=A0ABV7AII1_9RHOB